MHEIKNETQQLQMKSPASEKKKKKCKIQMRNIWQYWKLQTGLQAKRWLIFDFRPGKQIQQTFVMFCKQSLSFSKTCVSCHWCVETLIPFKNKAAIVRLLSASINFLKVMKEIGSLRLPSF